MIVQIHGILRERYYITDIVGRMGLSERARFLKYLSKYVNGSEGRMEYRANAMEV